MGKMQPVRVCRSRTPPPAVARDLAAGAALATEVADALGGHDDRRRARRPRGRGRLLVTGVAGAAGVVTVASINVLSEDLPDPSGLATLQFDQPTIVYDRTGKTELARFQRTKRTVVDYRDLPPLVLDATTTAEDRTFWENDGFDVTAMVAAAVETPRATAAAPRPSRSSWSGRGSCRPTSSNPARHLPAQGEGGHPVARVTAAFPGQTGKQQIITAYLNQIFYGHDAYGIAAAAQVYFGVSDLAKLTPAQAALLAALPQSPSTLDPYRFAVENDDGHAGRARDRARRSSAATGSSRTSRRAAGPRSAPRRCRRDREPVILVGDQPAVWRAPHFMWQVRKRAGDDPRLGRRGRDRRLPRADDARLAGQQLPKRSVTAAVIAPNLCRAERLLDQLKIGRAPTALDQRPARQGPAQRAIVALGLPDRRRPRVRGLGRLLPGRPRQQAVQPQVRRRRRAGTRQPGSACKPIVYATAFERRALTPGSLLLDITTEFAPAARWAPKDADQLERGPVLVREAMQMSLNLPGHPGRADRQRGGREAGDEARHQLRRRREGVPPGRARRRDRHGRGPPDRPHERVRDDRQRRGADAAADDPRDPRPERDDRLEGARRPGQTGDLGHVGVPDDRHPPREHRPAPERDLGREARAAQHARGGDGLRRSRPAPRTTPGTSRRTATCRAPGGQGRRLGVGVWMGNSDHSMPRSRKPATSLTAAAPCGSRSSGGSPTATRSRIPSAEGHRRRADRRLVGRQARARGPATRPARCSARAPSPGASGRSTRPGCSTPGLRHLGRGSRQGRARAAELGRRRPRLAGPRPPGPGVTGRHDSTTAYFWGRSGWGGPPRRRAVRTVVRDDDHRGGAGTSEEGDKPRKSGQAAEAVGAGAPSGKLVGDIDEPSASPICDASPAVIRYPRVT